MANKLVTVTQLDTAVDGFASAVAAAGYEEKANLKKLAYEDDVTIDVMTTDLKTLLDGKMTQAKAQELVDQNVGKAYKPGGSKTLATLPALTEANFGHVYHMTEDFVTTDDFVEGLGKSYTAGAEVAIVEVKEVLAPGTYDASGNLLKSWDQLYTDGDLNVINGEMFANPTGSIASTNVEKIVIDPSVTSIGFDAFSGCTSLTTITIPDGVTSIGDTAFTDCSNLTTIYYSGTATGAPWGATNATVSVPNVTYKYNVLSSYIDTSKFAAQSSFSIIKAAVEAIEVASNSDIQALIDGMSLDEETASAPGTYNASGNLLKTWDQLVSDGDVSVTNGELTTPDDKVTRFANTKEIVIDSNANVKSIGNSAFRDCTDLTTITIPNGVISIDSNAFRNCTSLTTITIPDSVTTIGENVFSDCTSLTEITIPDSVTYIGSNAFAGTSITTITIPDSVTSIGGGIFNHCTNLTTITIPSSVTSISEYAFESCTSLTTITIPDGVTGIGDMAFGGCTGLTEITIPDSVTSISNMAFSNCNNLTTIYYSGTATGAPWGAAGATVVA